MKVLKRIPKSVYKVLPLLLIAYLIYHKSVIATTTFNSVIFFGDSLTDQGNNLWVKNDGRKSMSVGALGAPVTNRPFEHNGHHYGKTWAQFLSSALFHQQPSLYSAEQSSNRIKVLNFAWASAETGNSYISDIGSLPFEDVTKKCIAPGLSQDNSYACTPNLLKQIDLYLKNGSGKFPKPNKKTLVFLFAGGNDVISNLIKANPFHSNARNQQPISKNEPGLIKSISIEKLIHSIKLSHPINNTVAAIKKLNQSGIPIKNIIVMNLPDLSKIPAAQKIAGGHFVKEIQALSFMYNKILRYELSRAGFSKIHMLDVYKFINELTENPSRYQLKNTTTPCVYESKKLENCEGYVFFNGKHPTIRTHQLLAMSFERCLLKWFPKDFLNHYEKIHIDDTPSSCSL